MTIVRKPGGLAILLWWVLASIVGMAVGWVGGWGVSALVVKAVTFALHCRTSFCLRVVYELTGVDVDFAVIGAVAGAVVGVAQWVVLQRQVSWARWWVLASIAGWALGWGVQDALSVGVDSVSYALGRDVYDAVRWAATGAVVGAVVGTMQWLVLRGEVPRARWWVLASSVGMAGAMVVAFALSHAVYDTMLEAAGPTAFRAVFGAVFGAVVGMITGFVLIWLLRDGHALSRGRG